jgi:integrase
MSHFTRSLRTSDKSEAIRRSRLMLADFENMLRELEGRALPPALPAASPITVPSVSAAALPTIPGLFRLFLADPAKARSRRTDMLYESLLKIVRSLWGDEAPIQSIDRPACRELLEVLRWLPANHTKRFPNMTSAEAAEMMRSSGCGAILNAATVNAYMTQLRAVLNFAMTEGWISRNPAKGLRVIDPVRRRDKRVPFSDDQLTRIFSAPVFTGCVDDEAHYAIAGNNHPRRGRFWVPVIALYSGMRLNEICQLDVADIRRVEGVDCIFVNALQPSEGNAKRLKTISSERFVPIHPALKEIGFMEFVAQGRAAGGARLFPELPLSATGYYSDPFSKWFSRMVRKIGADRPRTCFHSYRHGYKDCLREARVDHEIALALGGWASTGASEESETAAAYGRGYRMTTLYEAIKKVEYPNLDLSHLKPT